MTLHLKFVCTIPNTNTNTIANTQPQTHTLTNFTQTHTHATQTHTYNCSPHTHHTTTQTDILHTNTLFSQLFTHGSHAKQATPPSTPFTMLAHPSARAPILRAQPRQHFVSNRGPAQYSRPTGMYCLGPLTAPPVHFS